MKVYLVAHTIQVADLEDIDIVDIWSKTLVIVAKYFFIKKWIAHEFGPGAYTQAIILAESHAVIQTYPELNKVFITIEFHEEEGTKAIPIYNCLKELNETFKALECKTNISER